MLLKYLVLLLFQTGNSIALLGRQGQLADKGCMLKHVKQGLDMTDFNANVCSPAHTLVYVLNRCDVRHFCWTLAGFGVG